MEGWDTGVRVDERKMGKRNRRSNRGGKGKGVEKQRIEVVWLSSEGVQSGVYNTSYSAVLISIQAWESRGDCMLP